MRETFEPWNLPWQSLQHRLANGFGERVLTQRRREAAPEGAAVSPNWLERALVVERRGLTAARNRLTGAPRAASA